ncbi:pleiotropic drug resistance protein 3-like [Gossypium australe]|uniref:Pleiotropic drug resistance protein 3-like n=1 Tax=Gossypium australe TaxID=47621 RepID=A0A5B6VC63_9ROSI|nr:pleiotropic drug resistance protein 3-like [Gossypium australe]
MASASLSPPSTFILNGENYHIWVVKIKTYLQAYDLWKFVNTDVKLVLLKDNATVAQIKHHSGLDKTKQQQLINLKRDFENLKMKEAETVKQYTYRIVTVVNNIKLLEEEFADSKVVENFITTLPERYESKISLLEDSRDFSTISLLELINTLYAQEQRKATTHKDHAEEEALRALSIEGVNPKNIRERKAGQRGRRTEAAEEVRIQEEQVFAATSFVSKNKVVIGWLIDNGYTNHMTSDESIFRAYTNMIGDANLWHKRMRHANYKPISKMCKPGLVKETIRVEKQSGIRKVCQLGKQARLPFLVNKAWRMDVDILSCLLTTIPCIVGLPTKAVQGKAPFEAWFGSKPSVSHFKVFGCVCFVHVPKVETIEGWKDVIQEEMSIIHKNQTWELVDKPSYKKEETYMEQSPGFTVKGKEEKLYRMKKALYGFEKSPSEPTPYVKKTGALSLLIVLLYVEDLLVIRNNKVLIKEFKQQMENMFKMLDLGDMRYFLRMEV